MVVDDNETNRLIMSELLKALQVWPSLATSGEQALEKINQPAPDAVLIDIRMAPMDGWHLARCLRDIQRAITLCL